MNRRHPALIAVAALLLPGCSQVSQLQEPVAGAPVTMVRMATLDVLVAAKVPIAVAPVCTEQDLLITCRGSTTDGREILSQARELAEPEPIVDPYGGTSPPEMPLTIRVGAEEIFTGTVYEVIKQNGQVSP